MLRLLNFYWAMCSYESAYNAVFGNLEGNMQNNAALIPKVTYATDEFLN